MLTFAGDVREGMEVMSLDGVSLGTVGEVRAERVTDERHDFAHGMPPPRGTEGQDHFRFQGEADELSVPCEAIVILFPGQTITIGYTAEECRQRYGNQSPLQ